MAEDAFLNFRTLVSSAVIKIAYAAGFFLISVAGLLWMVYPFLPTHGEPPDPVIHLCGGVFVLTGVNLLWRLLCESVMLFFGIHEMVAAVEKNSKATAELLEGVARQLTALDANAELRHEELTRLLSTRDRAASISNAPSRESAR